MFNVWQRGHMMISWLFFCHVTPNIHLSSDAIRSDFMLSISCLKCSARILQFDYFNRTTQTFSNQINEVQTIFHTITFCQHKNKQHDHVSIWCFIFCRNCASWNFLCYIVIYHVIVGGSDLHNEPESLNTPHVNELFVISICERKQQKCSFILIHDGRMFHTLFITDLHMESLNHIKNCFLIVCWRNIKRFLLESSFTMIQTWWTHLNNRIYNYTHTHTQTQSHI